MIPRPNASTRAGMTLSRFGLWKSSGKATMVSTALVKASAETFRYGAGDINMSDLEWPRPSPGNLDGSWRNSKFTLHCAGHHRIASRKKQEGKAVALGPPVGS